jgi:hypothetical protein
MMQKKLTANELQTVMHARQHLRRVVNSGCHSVNMAIVLDEIDAIASHCTTDGKPYVEPQPEIGEGCRVATEADKWRRDRECYDSAAVTWFLAKPGIYLDSVTYRVPIDRIPTDEDAKQRPTVMVRDDGTETWRPVKLICVRDQYSPFVGLYESGALNAWKQARFPYPGELN